MLWPMNTISIADLAALPTASRPTSAFAYRLLSKTRTVKSDVQEELRSEGLALAEWKDSDAKAK